MRISAISNANTYRTGIVKQNKKVNFGAEFGIATDAWDCIRYNNALEGERQFDSTLGQRLNQQVKQKLAEAQQSLRERESNIQVNLIKLNKNTLALVTQPPFHVINFDEQGHPKRGGVFALPFPYTMENIGYVKEEANNLVDAAESMAYGSTPIINGTMVTY